MRCLPQEQLVLRCVCVCICVQCVCQRAWWACPCVRLCASMPRHVSRYFERCVLTPLRVTCGQTILNASLFVTDKCLYRGWFGSGASCRPCPVGGYCPGGDRIWPLPGYGLPVPVLPYPFSVCTQSAPCSKPDIAACRYWNPSEFSTSAPTPCMPPVARCIGGQYHACSAEYDGDYCASCRDGFYTRDGACVLCVASETQKVYIIIASFVVFLNLLFFSASADLTRTVVMILGMLKLFR